MRPLFLCHQGSFATEKGVDFLTQLNLQDITKFVAGQPLFTTDHLTAVTGERVGIIGANGAGKTTLVRIIAGLDHDYTGTCQVTGTIQLVPQLAPTQGQSGGQSTLARVRQALAQRPDILILDEPSANLDDEHQRWLGQTLLRFSGLLIVISHDRQLLRTIATKIWHVADHRYTQYNGTFSAHVAAQKRQIANATTHYHQQQQERRELQQAAQKRREKANRVRKGNRRLTAGERANTKTLREQNAGKLERSARALLDRADRQVNAVKPPHSAPVKLLATDLPPVTGKYLVNVHDLQLVRGQRQLLMHAQLRVRPGERVAILGPNGSGKSTLFHALLTHAANTHLADSARVGYFYQDMTRLPLDQTVWALMQQASTLDGQRTRQIMGAFGLTAQFYDRLVADLSGGERVKLQLLRILVGANNLLILDEPTNYLDLPALQALADYLSGYPGTVLFVAHDQDFRQRVATRTVIFKDQRLIDPQQTAHQIPADDLPRLRFEYDQLMLAPTVDARRLQTLRQQIQQLEAHR